MKASKLIMGIWAFFAALGLIFIIIGTIICFPLFSYSNKITTTGVISEITLENNVYVTYIVGHKEYTGKLNGYSSDFYEGKKVDIYYDKNNYESVGMKSLDMLTLILPGIGLIFFLIGGTGLFVILNKKNREKNLKAKGDLIYANYFETVINKNVAFNEKNPYNIICMWDDPETGIRYTFKSKNLWNNPEEIIMEKGIKKFPIYIDLKNKKKYTIDLDNIL